MGRRFSQARLVEPTTSGYLLVNHARWDRLRDMLPSMLFKRSFHTNVLEHFRANRVAALPVLYRLVPRPRGDRLMRKLLFGLNIDPRADRTAMAFQLASLADEHGLDVVSVMDHPEQPSHLETWTLLVALAMRTQRVAVMPNVASVPLRPPAMLAKAASTLAILTGGRVILGVGAGDPRVVRTYGGPELGPGEAVEALEEAVQVIRGLWDTEGRTVSFQGHHYRLPGTRPGPHAPTPVPLWIGSFAPRMLRLTGRLADGWAPTNRYADPEEIARIRHHVDRGATQAGRDPRSIRRNYNVMGAIDPQAATQDGELLVGGVDHWVEALGRYHRQLGFDSFVFWPVRGEELEQSRRFATEVVPRVRELASSREAGR